MKKINVNSINNNNEKKFGPLFNYISNLIYKDSEYGDELDNLRNKVLEEKNIVENDVEGIFGKKLAKSFCEVFYKYREKEKTIKKKIERKCGNPYIIHLLDGAIISHVMGLGYLTTLTYMHHDDGEIFSDTILDLEKTLENVPESIRGNVNVITNKYKLVAKYLKERSDEEEKTTWHTKHMFKYLEELNSKIKDLRLLKTTYQTENLLNKYDEKKKYKEKDVIDFLIEVSYPSYIYDMVTDVEETSKKNIETDILIPVKTKFIDRKDNTRTDTVLEFKGTLDIYNKNTTLLLNTKKKIMPIITQKKDLNAYFLYHLLIDVSLRQLTKQIEKFQKDRDENFYSLRFDNPINRLTEMYKHFKETFYDDWLEYNKKIENAFEENKGKVSVSKEILQMMLF